MAQLCKYFFAQARKPGAQISAISGFLGAWAQGNYATRIYQSALLMTDAGKITIYKQANIIYK